MGKIVLLDELTINQIAAGEVIERPASVVKEMVENSIDAGAKNIVVEIRKGGIDFIKITDDGSGISEDDMEISFERHATSKIRSSSDLQTVKTMGFRGEALASIAAIARVEMVSKTAGDDIGNKIVVEGGEVKEKTEIGCQKGTTITVQNLFYNTPVRYKFLRKDYTEAGYIEDVVTRIALVNKNVAIKLINSGKVVLQTSGNNDLKSTVYSIYGKDVANGIVEANYTYDDIKIKGVIGKPEIARGNRGYQLFFINGRYVKDKTLTSAADGAYKDILPIGKYGFLILNIEMDPKGVDVNVHPAKLEVRFENESDIYKAVYHAIKSGLENVSVTNILKSKEYNVEEKKIGSKFSSTSFDVKVKSPVEKSFEVKEELNFESKLDKIDNNLEENKKDSENTESDNSDNSYAELLPEEEIVQPRIRTGFSDLLKKVIGGGDENREEYKEKTLVEALFEERNGRKRSTPLFENSANIDNEKKESEKEEPITIYNSGYSFTKESIDDENMIPKNQIRESEIKEIEKEEKEIKESEFESKVESENEDKNFTKTDSEKEENAVKPEDDIQEEIENKEATENKESIETKEEIDNTFSGKTIKFGNATISSDTVETPIDINEFIKEETLENNEIESIAENIEELNDIEENNINDEDNIESESNKLTESIVNNKINNSVESTQILDMNEIRENIQPAEGIDPKEATSQFAEMYKKTFGKDITKRPEIKSNNFEAYNEFLYETSNENLNVFEEKESFIPERKYRFIGTVFNSYWIIEIGNEIYIIDQRLAYKKIIFERIKKNYYNEDTRNSQILLLPDIISLNKKQVAIANENIEMFEKAGFGFEDFGENTLKLYAVPGLCEKLNTKQLFIDILDGLDSVSIISKEEKEEKFISTIAYKSATKANLNLDDSEIIDVLNQLLNLNEPFVCSDGNQIAIKMSKFDFEKKFSRR